MKKFNSLLGALVTVIASNSFAAGYHYFGDVQINPAGTFMGGYMNVRYNTAAANSPYFYAAGSAGGSVQFGGRDINDRFFGCTVSVTSPIYKDALDIKNSLTDGSYLVVYKNADTSECFSVFLQKASFMLE